MCSFSLSQCQQAYAHMDIDLRSTLRDKLEAIAPEYGLVELSYPSFSRAFGYRITSLSAADAVEGLDALLQAATGVTIEVDREAAKGGGEWFGGKLPWHLPEAAGEKPRAEEGSGLAAHADQLRGERNFWVAYDALQK